MIIGGKNPAELIYYTEDADGVRTYYCVEHAPIPGYKWIDPSAWREALGHRALPRIVCSVCGRGLTPHEFLQDHPGGIW